MDRPKMNKAMDFVIAAASPQLVYPAAPRPLPIHGMKNTSTSISDASVVVVRIGARDRSDRDE